MKPPVTLVTARSASADQLTDADYHDIYDELRGRDPDTGEYHVSLRAFVAMITARSPGQQTLSIGYWSKYHNGEIQLSRRARQELRAVVGVQPLPPTVAEASATIDPDAAIYQVGERAASRVVMVGADVSEPITLHLNGRVEILDGERAETAAFGPGDQLGSPVTPVTTAVQPRKPSKAIRISPATFERLSAAHRASGLTWDAFLARLLGGDA